MFSPTKASARLQLCMTRELNVDDMLERKTLGKLWNTSVNDTPTKRTVLLRLVSLLWLMMRWYIHGDAEHHVILHLLTSPKKVAGLNASLTGSTTVPRHASGANNCPTKL
eukprot:scaffold1074_cov409-Prasinococcus_capsulatus_cf.AAC.1